MRNITDHRTGKWDLYAVSTIYERYGEFRRGAVWAKILVPNIPVQNGVVHIVDNVLGIVTNTIDQMLMDNYRCTTLMRYMATIGQIVRNYMSATGGLVTFFAPWNEAFERIPEPIERRLLRDRIWLEQVLKLHIIPAKELVSEEITNDTIIATVDNMRHLLLFKQIQMEDVTATNGIIHYIDRVLGVPYQSLWEVLRNETRAHQSMEMLNNLQLKYTLDPWQVLTPEQNMTFFVPIDEAWDKVSFYKIYGNINKIFLKDFELYWPRGNRVARIIEGGEIAGINGFMHLIDGVLVYEPDLRAGSAIVLIDNQLLLFLIFFILFW
uniref:FAS1 domain-containing protein n=1 Tax=Meloidogyne javanica TaxID=6303 RepID=A0A915MNE7_MELJA